MPHTEHLLITPMTATATFGLDAWAAAHGLDPHSALCLASSVLTNLAGESLQFNHAPGLDGSHPASCVISDSDIAGRRALASLVSPLSNFQRSLERRSSEFSLAEVMDVMYESRRLSGPGPVDEVARLLSDADPYRLGSRRQPDDQLGEDFGLEGKAIRFDAVTRPRILISGSLPKDLAATLSTCHQGRGLAAGAVELLPTDPKRRSARLEELTRYLAGEELPIPTHLSRSPIIRQTVCLSGVLSFPSRNLQSLVAEDRWFLERLLPVSPPYKPSDDPDPLPAQAFVARFARHAYRLVARRRAGAAANAVFGRPESTTVFQEQHQEFLRQLSVHPAVVWSPELALLPQMVAWSLLWLADGHLADAPIIEQSFATARHLMDACHRFYAVFDQQQEGRQRMELARKIVRRLADTGPVKRRELVRGFSDQRIENYAPVLAALVRLGVLDESPDRRLSVGTQPVTELKLTHFIEL